MQLSTQWSSQELALGTVGQKLVEFVVVGRGKELKKVAFGAFGGSIQLSGVVCREEISFWLVSCLKFSIKELVSSADL